MKYKELTAGVGGIIVLLILSTTFIPVQEYRRLVYEVYPNAPAILLEFDESNKLEFITRGSDDVLRWKYDHDEFTLYDGARIIARDSWEVQYERRYLLLRDVKDTSICSKITPTRCYVTDYYTRANTKRTQVKLDYRISKNNMIIEKWEPKYRDMMLKQTHIINPDKNFENFPDQYKVNLNSDNPRRISRLIWRIEKLDETDLPPGIYYADEYHTFKFGKVTVSVREEIDNVAWMQILQDGNEYEMKVFFKPQQGDYEYDVQLVDPASVNIGLYLDGLEQNRTYELGSNIQIHFNSTISEEICLDIDQPGYDNVSCSSSQGYYNYSNDVFYKLEFNDSSKTKDIGTSGDVVYIRGNAYDEFESFKMNISAKEGAGGGDLEMENLSIDVGNEGTIDFRLPGFLSDSYLSIKKTTDGYYEKQLTFGSGDSTNLVTYEFPAISDFLYTWIIKLYGEAFVGDFSLTFDTEQYKDASETDAIWNTTTETLHMDQIIINHRNYGINGSGSGIKQIRDFVGSVQYYNTFFNLFEDDSSSNTRVYAKGQDNSVLFDTKFSIEDVVDGDTVTIDYDMYCIAYGGSDPGWPRSWNYLYVRDWTNSEWDQIDSCTRSRDSFPEELDPARTTYDVNTDTNPEYRNSSGHVLFKTHHYVGEQGFCSACYGQGDIYFYDITVTTKEDFDTRDVNYQNTTTRTLFESSGIITNVTYYINTSNQTNDDITIYLSVDDGTNYNKTTTFNTYDNVVFGTVGDQLKVTIELGTDDKDVGAYLNYITFYNLTGKYPENISIDFDDDGIYEWQNLSVINETEVIFDVTDNASTEFQNRISECGTEYVNGCDFEVRIQSETSGILNFTLNATTESGNGPQDSVRTMNISDFDKSCISSPCDIPINGTWTQTADLVLNNVQFGFKGNGNFTVTAHNLSSSDQEILTVEVIYSPINVSLPPHIIEYEILPRSNDDRNITPFGQEDDTPIFNITKKVAEKTYTYDLYVGINESLNTSNCQNGVDITYYNSSDYTGGLTINSTPKIWRTGILNTTIWSRTSLYNCSIVDFYFWQFEFEFLPKCPSCVVTSDYT